MHVDSHQSGGDRARACMLTVTSQLVGCPALVWVTASDRLCSGKQIRSFCSKPAEHSKPPDVHEELGAGD